MPIQMPRYVDKWEGHQGFAGQGLGRQDPMDHYAEDQLVSTIEREVESAGIPGAHQSWDDMEEEDREYLLRTLKAMYAESLKTTNQGDILASTGTTGREPFFLQPQQIYLNEPMAGVFNNLLFVQMPWWGLQGFFLMSRVNALTAVAVEALGFENIVGAIRPNLIFSNEMFLPLLNGIQPFPRLGGEFYRGRSVLSRISVSSKTTTLERRGISVS